MVYEEGSTPTNIFCLSLFVMYTQQQGAVRMTRVTQQKQTQRKMAIAFSQVIVRDKILFYQKVQVYLCVNVRTCVRVCMCVCACMCACACA